MKKCTTFAALLICSCLLLFSVNSFSQTSWKGITSTAWNTAANWTNGIPTAAVDAIIGDANFTGTFQPGLNVSASCRALTIGGGAKTSGLTVGKGLTIRGNLVINSNGTITQTAATITIQGNWTNSGTYSATSTSAVVNFGGTSQILGGTTASVFRKLKINTSSTVTLATNISASGSSNYIYIYGTLNPGVTPTYTITAATTLRVFANGVLKVNAATVSGNYVPALTLSTGSIVEYSSTTVNQTISSLTYSTLKISGGTVKSLAANLPSLGSSNAAYGNIYVTAGTLDLLTYTANRGTSVAGGNFIVSNGATLKIGGTNSFPANYASNTLSLTSNTEYNGTTQVVAAKTYGNLTLSSSAGAAAKSASSTVFTIAGNFVTKIGAGTGVTFTAGANITVSGIDSIGASTTFNGGSYTHAIAGNWVNNGTFTGNTSTINMTGAGTTISGAGAQNFYSLSANASNISSGSATINIAGNLSTSGSGTFTHNSGNTLIMTGAAKTITGLGITLGNLTISGTVTTTSTCTIRDNLSVTGSFLASTGNISITGAAKTISGAGSIGFYGLLIPGTVTTSANFSVSNALDISGTFSASAGTTTFTGSSTLNGTANLYNVTLNGTSLLLSTNSILGIANVYTITAGLLDVTTAIPNTVNFNGGAQNIPSGSYYRLLLSSGGTKTATGAIITDGNFTIDPSVTFNAASFTHTVNSNLVNNGTFTSATSTTVFSGLKDVTISGATTFNILTINKAAASNVVTLLSNVSAPVVNMTSGYLNTGANTLTITNTRTGNGIIYGNIQRTHSFTTGTAYAFESPDNSISFSSVSAVTSITVAVTATSISDFPFGAASNRLYDITIPAGTYNATLRLHYEDVELNGNSETNMLLWNYNGSSWLNSGKTGNSITSNYVEQSGLTSIAGRWTLSGVASVLRWNGSVSNAWTNPGNWTVIQGSPGSIPGANDIVEIGQAAITNQPSITTPVSIKNMEFGSASVAALTIAASGSLTTSGNIGGVWTSNATHTINAGAQNITVNGSLTLSDGTPGHAINLNVTTGTVTVKESMTQSGGANISITGTAALHLSGDFVYSSGAFDAGTSTVYYEGSLAQIVGGVTYNNITVAKTGGIANIPNSVAVGGTMAVTAGEVTFKANSAIAGNLTISTGAIITFYSVTLSIGGDLNNSGTFNPGGGTISFTGTGPQMISLATFNNIVINKPSGAINFTGNINVYGNFSLLSGSIDLGAYTANRTSLGGVFIIAAGAALTVSGNNNFPSNYSSYLLDTASTVTYSGTGIQSINGIAYGNLVASNGGANIKTLAGAVTVKGNLTLNSGAGVDAGIYNLSLAGNWVNNGTFIPSTGAVLLYGTNKTITGTTTFNKLTVYGIYTVAGSNITYNGLVNVTAGGSLDGGAGIGTVNGDLTNNGILISTGTTTFSGTSVQTIRLFSPIQSTVNGVINFNGSVAPVLNSTAVPQFATLNINNTGGINPSVNWIVGVAFNISAGAVFNGGISTHTIYGSFTNNGTVTSSGTLNFYATLPSLNYTLAGTSFSSTGTVIFGGPYPVAVSGASISFNDVIISNTGGVTPAGNWNVGGNFTLNSNSIFNAGNYSYAIGGDIESNGTLNGGTSTFTMSSATGMISGSPGTTFYNYTADGSITANADFNISNNFTNNSSFDATLGNPVMTGSGASIIGGTASTYSLAQLEINKTGSGTAILANNITDVMNLDIVGGTLDASTYAITELAGSGTLLIRDNATLKIGGTNGLPAFANYSLDSLSMVEYYGSTQTITSIASSGAVYGNLSISAAGTKTANGALNIRNNFTLTNGTFVTGAYTDTLGGNWNMTSGVLTSTGTTLTLDGSNTQDIVSTGAFNNLVVNKSAGAAALSGNITLGGTLTFTSGNINTGSNKLIMSSNTPVVNGAAQSTGWVYGKLQKTTPTGATSRTFEVGGNTVYTPVTVAFANVTSAGSLTVNNTGTDHPDLANSGIDINNSVNRYWTFTNSATAFTTATVTYNWVAADVDAGSTAANFKVKNYNGSSWTLLTVASPTATSIQATGITSLNEFAIGEVVANISWTGATNTSWSTAGNWSSGVPSSSTNVTIPSSLGNYPVLNAGTGTVLNLTIQTGATLTITGATLQIHGAITNTGTFNAAAGTIEMSSTIAQTIPAGVFQNSAIKDLIINNSAGVTIGGALGITGVLTLTSGQLTTGGFITLKSSALATARVAPVTGGTISGNITVERYLSNRRAWRLLTLPVAYSNSIFNAWQNGRVYQSGKGTFITGPNPNPSVNGLDSSSYNNVSMKGFSTATQAFQNITNTRTATLSDNIKDNADNKGYFIFSRGDRNPNNLNAVNSSATTLSGSGKLQVGAQLFPASATANTYTLLGNPFPSPIDFSLLTKTNLVNRFIVWDPALNQVGGYVTVDDLLVPGTYVASPSSAQTKEIQSGQAFFVLTLSSGAASMEINENSKSAVTNSAVFRPVTGTGNPVSFRSNLYLRNADNSTELADGALVQYKDGFNAGVDWQDAAKFSNINETVAILRDGAVFSIERRPLIVDKDTIFFKITKTTQRNYQFTFIPEGLDTGLEAFLEDSYTNITLPVNLTSNSIVNFTVDANAGSQVSNRFRIVFKTLAVLPVTYTSVKAQLQNNAVAVEWKVENQLNIEQYEVEKSTDGGNFVKIFATPANSNTLVYHWLDEKPADGANFYRIKNVDKDGRFQYSTVVKVNINQSTPGFVVYPNPVTNNTIGLQITSLPKGDYTLRLINMAGQVMFISDLNHPGGSATETLKPGKHLSKGIYKLELTDGLKNVSVMNINVE